MTSTPLNARMPQALAQTLRERLGHVYFQRHLLREFLVRDLVARYIGTIMGFFWSVIHPLILLLVYTMVFGIIIPPPQLERLAQRGWDGEVVGFAFYIFCGLLPWYAFQESLVRTTTSIADHAHLIKQVRFPAKILPVYITLSSLVNQLIGTAIFLLFQLAVLGSIPVTLAALPLVLFFQFLFFLGLGLLFSTMNTYVRDVAPLVSIGTMILMWTTPMLYTLEIVPEPIRPILYANPVTYLVLLHHEVMLFGEWPSLALWSAFGFISLAAFVFGYAVFTRCHAEFADLL